MGLTLSDLFADDGTKPTNGALRAHSTKPSNGTKPTNGARPPLGPIVEAYAYEDESGTLLSQNVRYTPKDFRQRRPDGHGNWIANVEGVRRVLYRLPQLIDVTDVYIPEGEKDVHSLEGIGLVATCNAAGAGKWKPEYTDQLKRAGCLRVNVLPDNDKAGRDHAQAVAASCHAAGLLVKVIDLPNLPPKGDVSDWLAAGGTRDQLLDLVAASPLWTPSEATEAESATDDPRSLELIRASDVQVVKLEWLWFARLARGAITLLEGGPEKGKSTILVDLAARVSRGHSFPGDHVGREPGNVVELIAEDDIHTTVVPRHIAAGADLNRIFFLGVTKDERGEVVPFHLSDDGARLLAKCREVNAALVIVDPLVSFLGSRKGRVLNTNNDLEVRKALGPLKELAEQLRASVVAIRHYRKGTGIDAMEAGGGSVAFAALVRVILAALPDPNDPAKYLLAVAKNNLVKKERRPAFGYEIVPSTGDPDIGCVAWGKAVDMSAGEILMEQAEASKDTSGKAAEARAFLGEFLASGEWVLTTEMSLTK